MTQSGVSEPRDVVDSILRSENFDGITDSRDYNLLNISGPAPSVVNSNLNHDQALRLTRLTFSNKNAVLSEGENQMLTAFFVPTDSRNYEPVIETVFVNVIQDQPITDSSPKGDFNSDGFSDLIFQNSTDGSLAIWYMDGVKLNSTELLSPSSPGGTWKVVAPK